MVTKTMAFGIAGVMVLIVAGLYLSFGPTAAGWSPPGCGPSGSDWIINTLSGSCTCNGGETINMAADANVIVKDPGVTLNLGDCKLHFVCSSAGSCGIIVNESASLVVGSGALIVGDTQPFFFRVLGGGTTLDMNGATVANVGVEGPYPNSGVYIEGATATIQGGTISGGYNGIVFDSVTSGSLSWATVDDSDDGIVVNSSSGVEITWNTVDTASGDGIYFYNVTNGLISHNTVKNSGGNGIVVNQSVNVSVSFNNATNNQYGILVATSNLSLANVTDNFVFKNNKDGILNSNPTGRYDMTRNTILNNSGFAVYTNITTSGVMADVFNNTMCYNSNTTYWVGWSGGPVPYYYSPGDLNYAPGYNKFCVNITRPIKGGCTKKDYVNFHVDGNPWAATIPHSNLPHNGFTNCTLYIDETYRNSSFSTGFNITETLLFDGTAIGDGYHTLKVICDPPADETHVGPNDGEDNTTYTRDTVPPSYNFSGSGGVCGNITLAARWYDQACNVSFVVLSTNETYQYKNYTGGEYGSPMLAEWSYNWTNFSWWNSSMNGTWINWLVWGNDSADNWNKSTNATFLAVPCANTSTVIAGTCGTLTLKISWNGTAIGQSMAVLSTNETGEWKNYTNGTYGSPANITDGSEYTNFSWWNASMVGQIVGWKAYWNSTLGDWHESSNSTFVAGECTSPPAVSGGGGGAAVLNCPSCPNATAWSSCVNGRQTRLEWKCSANTSYKCANFTNSMLCSCPTCPKPGEWGKCEDGWQSRTAYKCSDSTNFACAQTTETLPCAITGILPFFEEPEQYAYLPVAIPFLPLIAIILLFRHRRRHRKEKKMAMKKVTAKKVVPKKTAVKPKVSAVKMKKKSHVEKPKVHRHAKKAKKPEKKPPKKAVKARPKVQSHTEEKVKIPPAPKIKVVKKRGA